MHKIGILFDLDGVIYQGDSLISGAKESINLIRQNNIPFRFITNTTRMTKKNLITRLQSMGLTLDVEEVFAAPHAAVEYCKIKGYKKIALVVPDKDMEEDFSDFELHAENPQAIVLGDMGNQFSFDLLNTLFNKILNGAEIVAMHKNKFWHSGNELTLDLGAFVAGLEFATGKEAVVIGKPNPHLFQLAVTPWGLPFKSIYMVGDDIDGDIRGANNVGMQSVLVRTGKYRRESLNCSAIKPDYIINSVDDLPELLQLN
ncbi:MAG: TIGR01458 family HAD-type hydrolase [Candidatus Marinimicrobia bacterium]|nr:TIGR01458 family HAD-type hydrolase [Candidatus Neomarinimicrobiota bacterium]